MEEIELWKPVVGFEDLFLISSFGRIKSIRHKNEKILKQTILKTGYYTLATKIGGRKGKPYCFGIHRLVAEAFLDKPTDEDILKELDNYYGKIPVNHIDGNKLNNNYTNLEWCTYKENSIHAFNSGLSKGKSQFDTRKLSNEDVKYIRNNYKPRCKFNGARALGILFGLDKNRIIKVYNNEIYKDVV